MQEREETRVLFLGWEDPQEEDMAIHSSVLAWRIPRTEEPGVTTGSQRVEHDQTTYHTAQKHATIPSLKIKNNIYGDRVPQ